MYSHVRAASRRTMAVKTRFGSEEEAVTTWFAVLMHEAREAMDAPLEQPPVAKYLHPVDVETPEPGIVVHRDDCRVARFAPENLAKVVYTRRTPVDSSTPPPQRTTIDEHDMERARRAAQKELDKKLKRAERNAQTCQRQERRQLERKEARANETPEARQERLEQARQKRQECKKRRTENDISSPAPATRTESHSPSEDALMVSDTSNNNVLDVTSLKKRRNKGKISFYGHPLPHHRHRLRPTDVCPLGQPSGYLVDRNRARRCRMHTGSSRYG